MAEKEKKTVQAPVNVRQLAKGVFAYTGLSIFGPLALFGGLGYALDRHFGRDSHLFLVICIAAAFILTNFLIFRKVRRMMRELDQALKNDGSGKKAQ